MLAFGLSGKLPNGIGRARRGQFNWLHQAIQSIAEWYFERLSWRLASNVNVGCVCPNCVCYCRAKTLPGFGGCVGVEAE